jgi:hypothetical protein
MDAKLRQIVSKSAGTYFIVTDASQVATIENESKMRLFFINMEKGAVNMLFKFAKGDIAGFTSIFGKNTRLQEKKGNFSSSSCIEALAVGPIAVINLRSFEDTDITGVVGMNPNVIQPVLKQVPYTNLFNTNNFWTPQPQNMVLPTVNSLLEFGNVGNNNISIFVTFATSADVLTLTAEGDKTLAKCALEIDEYPALNTNILLKETFVNVYVFNNIFNPLTVGTNQYYGHLFDFDGNLDFTRIDELINISEAGFSTKFTGSLIPGLVSENTEDISIDKVINQQYMNIGLIAYINDDLFEDSNKLLLDVHADEFFDEEGVINTDFVVTGGNLLSHVLPTELTTETVVYPLTVVADNVAPLSANIITYGCTKVSVNSFEGSFEQGLRIDDLLRGEEETVKIESIEILNPSAVIGIGTYTKVLFTCSGAIKYKVTVVPPVVGTGTVENPEFPATTKNDVYKLNLFTKTGLIKPFLMENYIPRTDQFITGTLEQQKNILDMIVSPGIVKGLKSVVGLRYVVDCFKSFVEPSYKSQFGSLMVSLDEGNKFVRSILNEPFIEDLQKSSNPLFKQTPTGIFDWSYVPDGGNKSYSNIFLSKFSLGAEMCFFFGPGNVVGSVTRPVASLVSNLFYSKTYAYDVVANASGYVDGITALESEIDDIERASCEKFNYNPIIEFNGGKTIFGNLTGQKANTAQKQIHNSELLAYIKENLYNLAKTEAFKKGNYDDYLRTETETKNFMVSLSLVGAIEANPIVICNSTNNTKEIAKNKIKLVHIEYIPIDALEKVVFDLQIN